MPRKVIIRGGRAWEEPNLYFLGKEKPKESGGFISWLIVVIGIVAVGVFWVYK